MNEQAVLEPSPVAPDLSQGSIIDTLALMPERGILDEKAMATTFGVTPRTVRRMVRRREIPPGVPFAGRTIWMAGKVLAFLEKQLEKAEESARKRAAALSRISP